ncbi:MAG: apiosidase-like domain-containing protein [Thermoguttaceae bacterium]
MTYHINGNNSSSQWFHKAPWLDFNMIQVWGNEKEIYPKVIQDYALSPARPTGLGEGSYEDGPQYSTRPIDALKVRKQAYWSYLAGGYQTYGNTNSWNFGTCKPEATQEWKEALKSPGAEHLSILKKFLTATEWWKLEPDASVFVGGTGSGEARHSAVRSTAGDRVLVYLSHPDTVTLRLDGITAAKTVKATWVDPRTGTRTVVGEFPTCETNSYSAPKGWPDAILLLEAKDGIGEVRG